MKASDWYFSVVPIIMLYKVIRTEDDLIYLLKKQVCDILNTESGGLCSDQKFDVCLDKGTYDAISLNLDDATGCQAKYINNVSCLLAPDGVFIICSCNWTKPELLAQFSNSKWDD